LADLLKKLLFGAGYHPQEAKKLPCDYKMSLCKNLEKEVKDK